MLKEAIEYLVGQGRDGVRFETVYKDNNRKLVAHVQDGAVKEIQRFDLPPRPRDHTFDHMTGLVDYLNGPLCASADEGKGAAFVSREAVAAEVVYGDGHPQRVSMPLTLAPECAALMELWRAGMGQRALWEALATDLNGCIDSSLFLAVANIKVKRGSEEEVSIDSVGMMGAQKTGSLKITYPKAGAPENAEQEIPVDYEWRGRIWSAFDFEETVQCRLTVSVEGSRGLVFRLHPAQWDKTLESAQLTAVSTLQTALNGDRWQVVAGRL